MHIARRCHARRQREHDDERQGGGETQHECPGDHTGTRGQHQPHLSDRHQKGGTDKTGAPHQQAIPHRDRRRRQQLRAVEHRKRWRDQVVAAALVEEVGDVGVGAEVNR